MTTAAYRARSVVRRHIRSLEDLVAYGNELDDVRRASLFEFGDLIDAYLAHHANGQALSPAATRGLCRSIASGSRLSAGFLYNLVRVARAFPDELREAYADRPWGWFLECVREQDPLAAAERYARLSIGQIKDLRKTKAIRREPGALRLQITLRADQVGDLLSGRVVRVTRVLPDGAEADVTVALRGAGRLLERAAAIARTSRRPSPA